MRASQLIPSSMPLLKDPKFVADRRDFSGRSWERDMVERMRPEAVVEIRSAFELLEGTLLGDGRHWVLGTEGVSLADVEGMRS